MCKVLWLVMASMLTVSLSATGNLPSVRVRGDIFDLMYAGNFNGLAAVLDQNGLTVSSVITEGGMTLLHYAALTHDMPDDVVKYLLENGAEVSPLDNFGSTPLDMATNKAGRVALLEQEGAVHGEDHYFTRERREREAVAATREGSSSTRERSMWGRYSYRVEPSGYVSVSANVESPSRSRTRSTRPPSDDPGPSRKERLKDVFDENLPLMRAMVLRQLGLPLHDWLAADAQSFRDIVSLRVARSPRYIGTLGAMSGDELLDTGLARYLPSVYALSADDVLDSVDVLDDFTSITQTQTGRHSHEKLFNLKSVVDIVNKSLSNTGRREIIDNLNRLDVDEVAELLPKFSLAYNLRIAQAVAEKAQSPLNVKLPQIMFRKQDQLELNKKMLTSREAAFFAASVEEIEQLEEELSNLQKLNAMPHSAEKDTMLAEFHANHLTASNHLLTFTSRDLAWLQRTKIGKMALQDVNLSALAALHQVAELHQYYTLNDDIQRRKQLLDLLDEHLQQALATN